MAAGCDSGGEELYPEIGGVYTGVTAEDNVEIDWFISFFNPARSGDVAGSASIVVHFLDSDLHIPASYPMDGEYTGPDLDLAMHGTVWDIYWRGTADGEGSVLTGNVTWEDSGHTLPLVLVQQR